jgi:hypothetical protein
MPQSASAWRTAARACRAEARSASSSVRLVSPSAPAGWSALARCAGGRSFMALIPSRLAVLPSGGEPGSR